MNKEDSLILMQLVSSLKKAVGIIEFYYIRNDIEGLERAKKEALEIRRKIDSRL